MGPHSKYEDARFPVSQCDRSAKQGRDLIGRGSECRNRAGAVRNGLFISSKATPPIVDRHSRPLPEQMRQAAGRPETALRRNRLYGSLGGFEEPFDLIHTLLFQSRMDRKSFNLAETEIGQGA